MGGAERNARRKRQARTAGRPAPAPAAQRGAPERGPRFDRRTVVIGAVVVVLLVGAVVGGVIYTNSQKNATEGQEIGVAESARDATVGGDQGYPVRRDGAVVVVGEDSAEVTLDVYEDFLCPACRVFEENHGKEIEKLVHEGTVRARYHMLPMLDERSDPPGYSLDAANAALCAADAGVFPAFHLSLFDAQPEEGTRGWDEQQLVKLGEDLGATSSTFESCVEEGEYDSLVQEHFADVRATEYLQQEFDGRKSFGTPTVAVGEKSVDVSDPNWLDELVDG